MARTSRILLLPRLDADALVHEVSIQVSAPMPSRMVRSSRPIATVAGMNQEYELIDTGVFDEDRYFDVFVEYAKAAAEDVLIQITVHNRGPDRGDASCVLPTLWFRNIWSWGGEVLRNHHFGRSR